MRFEELFQVEITVADGLLNNGYETPTMIIQPFVENAINHGLSERRDGQGSLSIGFSQIAPDTLCCIVSDNGVGRKHAAQRARAGHKSRGMLIVQEKIDTLLAADLVKVSYTIADAHPADEDFPGTVVTIHFKSLDDANH
jgi:LytS/YehU family sensor histidine kinase